MAYEPKIDPNAVVDGYLGVDPKYKGEVSGYIYGEQVKKMAEELKKDPK